MLRRLAVLSFCLTLAACQLIVGDDGAATSSGGSSINSGGASSGTAAGSTSAGGSTTARGSTTAASGATGGTTTSGGAGPIDAGVTIDFGAPTGVTVPKELWGFSTGELENDGGGLLTDPIAIASLQQVEPTLMRFAAAGDFTRLYADAGDNGGWDGWLDSYQSFADPDVRVVMGVGPFDSEGVQIPGAQWASWAAAWARHLQAIGHEVFYWEVGDSLAEFGVNIGLGDYESFFVPIADALHAVNPSYLVGGPAQLYPDSFGSGSIAQFANDVGAKCDFILWQMFYINYSTDDLQTVVYDEKGYNNTDITDVRSELQGTPLAGVPFFLQTWNMCGESQQSWGCPWQAQYIGAVYADLVTTAYFQRDPQRNFTMAALQDIIDDGYYGAVGNEAIGYDFSQIDAQGYLLGYAGQHLPGAEVQANTTLDHLAVMATLPTANSFAIKLTNWDVENDQTVALDVAGRVPTGAITRWEIGKENPDTPALSTQLSLGSVDVPSEQIVILTGALQ